MSLSAGLWQGMQPSVAGGGALDSSITDPAIGAMYLRDGTAPRPGGVRQVAAGPGSAPGSRAASLDLVGSSGAGGGWNPFEAGGGGSSNGSLAAATAGEGPAGAQQGQQEGQHSVLLMGVCSEGQVWQWQLPLMVGAARSGEAKPAMPKVQPLGERVQVRWDNVHTRTERPCLHCLYVL